MDTDTSSLPPPVVIDPRAQANGGEDSESSVKASTPDQAAESARTRTLSDDAAENLAFQRARVRGEAGDVTLEHGAHPQVQWQDPMDAFLAEAAADLPEDEFIIERNTGVRTKLRLRAIPTERYNRLVREQTTRKMDKALREVVEVVNEEDLKAALILEATLNIDFNDPRLRQKYGAVDVFGLVRRMFLKGEIEQLGIRIAELSGYERKYLEDQAGNS